VRKKIPFRNFTRILWNYLWCSIHHNKKSNKASNNNQHAAAVCAALLSHGTHTTTPHTQHNNNITFHSRAMSNSTNNNDDDGVSQKSSLAYTLSLNLIIFAGLILFFELNRNLPRLFLKRLRKTFEIEDRVPGRPPRHLFGWIRHVMAVSNGEFLRMIGLDGYMLLRFVLVCFKFCSFGSFFGLIILVPLYGQGSQGYGGWQQYTLANVVSSGEVTTDALWLPAAFSYMYLAYVLYLLHAEFEHFVLKRLEFLIQGDPDTFQQTHYTIMIENVPPSLRSVTALSAFFDKLFPGNQSRAVPFSPFSLSSFFLSCLFVCIT
jgi:hypothetical protein